MMFTVHTNIGTHLMEAPSYPHAEQQAHSEYWNEGVISIVEHPQLLDLSYYSRCNEGESGGGCVCEPMDFDL